MDLLAEPPDPSDPARLETETTRTADRLRTLSLTRLGTPLADGSTRAAAAYAVAAAMADWTADLSGRPTRPLPELPDRAVGDVLAVCGLDLAEEVRDRPSEAAAEHCRAAVERLVALRRLI